MRGADAMADSIMFLTVPDDPKKITVAITIKDGDDRECITEVMWNAYLTWHKVNDEMSGGSPARTT